MSDRVPAHNGRQDFREYRKTRNTTTCVNITAKLWPAPRHTTMLNTALDIAEDLHFDALNDEEFNY